MIINSIDIIGTFTYYKENFFNVKITIVPQLRYSVWISGKGLNGAIIEEIYSDKMEINPGESKSIKLSILPTDEMKKIKINDKLYIGSEFHPIGEIIISEIIA